MKNTTNVIVDMRLWTKLPADERFKLCECLEVQFPGRTFYPSMAEPIGVHLSVVRKEKGNPLDNLFHMEVRRFVDGWLACKYGKAGIT